AGGSPNPAPVFPASALPLQTRRPAGYIAETLAPARQRPAERPQFSPAVFLRTPHVTAPLREFAVRRPSALFPPALQTQSIPLNPHPFQRKSRYALFAPYAPTRCSSAPSVPRTPRFS